MPNNLAAICFGMYFLDVIWIFLACSLMHKDFEIFVSLVAAAILAVMQFLVCSVLYLAVVWVFDLPEPADRLAIFLAGCVQLHAVHNSLRSK